jgi:hypothetical protein
MSDFQLTKYNFIIVYHITNVNRRAIILQNNIKKMSLLDRLIINKIYLGFLIFACAAAKRAIGTLNGEHDT